MEGLIPFADAVKELLNKKFSGNKFHIGIDAAPSAASQSVQPSRLTSSG